MCEGVLVEEDIRFPKVVVVGSCLIWVLGFELESSGKGKKHFYLLSHVPRLEMFFSYTVSLLQVFH